MNLSNNCACGMLFCYNEEHILKETMKHYLSQGIDLVIVDNYSTDSSMDIVKEFQNRKTQYRGIVRDVIHIEGEGYEWKKILRQSCDYMHQKLNHYEWILLIDADAFYYSPVKNTPILEFMNIAKKDGCNIINGKVYEFYPTEKDNSLIDSHIERIKYYKIKDVCGQHKIFLYHPTVDFYSSNGHVLMRDNARVYVKKFIYKHYPWVSYEHGLKKIFTDRKPRYMERKTYPKMHKQYMAMLPLKKDFIKSSRKLKYFEEKKELLSKFRFFCIRMVRFLIDWRNAFFYSKLYVLIRLLVREIKKKAVLIIPNEYHERLRRLAGPFKPILKSSNGISRQEPYTSIFPHTYHFLMTNYCNAQCIFCNQKFNHRSKKEITLEEFKVILSNIPIKSAKVFYFSGGGEPLLCRDLVAIIRYVNISFPWIKINIRTNGLLIGKYAQDIAQLNISRLEISVHGVGEAGDAILQRKGSHDIFDGIAMLNKELKLRNTKMHKAFYIAVSQLNIGEVPQLIKKANALNVDEVAVFFCRYHPDNTPKPGRQLKIEESLFFNKQLYNATILSSKKLAASLRINFRHDPLFFKDFKEKICLQPWNLVLVDCDGEIYPCCGGEVWFNEKVKAGEYHFGNLLREHLHECWNSESYIKIRRTCNRNLKEDFIPECKNCHRTICFKGPDVENGHILSTHASGITSL